METKTINILANDPSITAWGWAVITIKGDIIATGCIKTAPEQKKRRIRKSDDTSRRVQEINTVLLRVIKRYNVAFIITESPHGSQNSSAAIMIGIVTAITQTMSDCLNIPIEAYSEGDSKKHLLGKLSATKKETIAAINKLYKVPWTGIGFRDEAVADAIAVYHVAVSQSPTIRVLKNKY